MIHDIVSVAARVCVCVRVHCVFPFVEWLPWQQWVCACWSRGVGWCNGGCGCDVMDYALRRTYCDWGCSSGVTVLSLPESTSIIALTLWNKSGEQERERESTWNQLNEYTLDREWMEKEIAQTIKSKLNVAVGGATSWQKWKLTLLRFFDFSQQILFWPQGPPCQK
jgi:hypothetical protein